MTGYTVHTGSTVKFSGGWDRVFSSKAGPKAGAGKPAKGKKKGGKKSRRSK